MQIINSNGQKTTPTIIEELEDGSLSINFEGLPKGIYFVEVILNNTLLTKKIVLI